MIPYRNVFIITIMLPMESHLFSHLFLNMEDVDIEFLDRPISNEDMLAVLKELTKEKIPCLNGWTMEYVLLFFDIMGLELM